MSQHILNLRKRQTKYIYHFCSYDLNISEATNVIRLKVHADCFEEAMREYRKVAPQRTFTIVENVEEE